MLVLYTFYHVLVPILIPMAIGALLHRKFEFNLGSFSKLILYYFVPALAFVKVYQAKLPGTLIITVFGFLIIQFIAIVIIGYTISHLLKYSKPLSASFANSVCLTNNGNIGIPINSIAFKQDPFAMSIQIMVVVFELFVTFTFGLINSSKATSNLKSSLLQFAKMPVLYAIIIGSIFNFFNIQIPEPIFLPISNIADGMLSFALVSIGAQISSTKFSKNTSPVFLSSLTRLIISPICAFFIIKLLSLQAITAQTLFIASAIPTSRNSAALALEYGNEPGFAAQAVLVSTLLSSITLTFVINFAQKLF